MFSTLAAIITIVVAIIHVWIMVLEMYLWDKPFGRKAFRLSPEQAQMTKVLAANQGLYNGVLAAGLFAALVLNNLHMQLFLLVSIIVLGIFGGMTSSKKIIYIQAVPALLAAILTVLGNF